MSAEKWCLGATAPRKVIHRDGCRYARRTYAWAWDYPDAAALVEALEFSGALAWHSACSVCCRDVCDLMEQARRQRARAVVNVWLDNGGLLPESAL